MFVCRNVHIPISSCCECNRSVSVFRVSGLFGKKFVFTDSDFRFRFYGDGRDIFIFVLTIKSDSVDFGGDTNSIFHHSFLD